ncbi:MAG: recombinase family protein [Caldilineaceae bacterium]|nr:recombinase family protein [Caldilineaceae bacterium]
MARKLNKRQSSQQLDLGVKVDATALYIRVSTSKQAEEGFSLDAQRERLDAYCVSQGWTVDADLVYVDAGESGKTTDRAAFQAMLKAAEAGQVKRIVAIKLDRLARNVRDFLGIVEQLNRLGVDLVLIKESFDTSTPHGKFALTMFAAMAELEAATITERVMTGKAQKASEGGYNGAYCPLGYDYDGEVFTANMHAETVRYIFEQFNAGKAMSKIAAELNEGGNPTARGGKWYAGTVRYILTNGFYAGLAQWDDTEAKGSHPAIIDLETYHTAIRRLKALKPGPMAKAA